MSEEIRKFDRVDASQIVKVDKTLGLVFGYAIVCKEEGAEYFDTQGDHIPEDSMLEAACDFMANSRVAKDMHTGDQVGSAVFAFPLTSELAKALEITCKRTGLLVAMRPDDENREAILTKYETGEYTGFSIGGYRITDEEVA